MLSEWVRVGYVHRSYACHCQPGYALHEDLHQCVNIDECAEANGHCSDECMDTRV